MTKKLKFSLSAGFIFGFLDILAMLPLELVDKNLALIGAFINRFTIGFLVVLIDLPFKNWQKGFLLGLLLSLPDGIITKAFLPIVGIGILGGTVIGFVADRKFK